MEPRLLGISLRSLTVGLWQRCFRTHWEDQEQEMHIAIRRALGQVASKMTDEAGSLPDRCLPSPSYFVCFKILSAASRCGSMMRTFLDASFHALMPLLPEEPERKMAFLRP